MVDRGVARNRREAERLDTYPDVQSLKHGQTVLRPGPNVTFRFPFRVMDKRPKVRPCLVLDLRNRESKRLAVLACRTTAPTNANRGYEGRVYDDHALKLTGLRKTG